jgi:hypothetical protein
MECSMNVTINVVYRPRPITSLLWYLSLGLAVYVGWLTDNAAIQWTAAVVYVVSLFVYAVSTMTCGLTIPEARAHLDALESM